MPSTQALHQPHTEHLAQQSPLFLLTRPDHYEIAYSINPWMDPSEWSADADNKQKQAWGAWQALNDAIIQAGGYVLSVPGAQGYPDMVFPANSAIVLGRRALLSHFRHEQRRGEEQYFTQIFDSLKKQGLLDEVARFPENVHQEGAGDCMWDACRGCFWAGCGPRSDPQAAHYVEQYFEQPVKSLELVDGHFYHLDVCFNPLPGGEVIYYPDAFTAEGLATIEASVPIDKRLVCSREEARSLALNSVSIGNTVILTKGASLLRQSLTDAGYRIHELDLDPFLLSGGAAFCMSLRLDQ